MFSRKHDNQTGAILPEEWTDKARIALNTRFDAVNETYEFHVYGEVLSDEIIIIASALKRELEMSPVCFFLSLDIDEKSIKKKDKLLEKMLNTTELFFEEVFDTDNWSDYSSRWLETESFGENFFYKATRENIYLTIEANKLLGE